MSGTTRHPAVAVRRQKPPYFEPVRERAGKRWDQLESDQELSGPWKQLFAQVQSPRHVLSELLQNADDAGAKCASAFIVDGYFVFEHDGQDFDEDQFASLCRFGFSNKRNLHTIGFRGVGFKSTFSLGDTVEVLTPSLAVRFGKRRFTEPLWIGDAPSSTVTRIAVRIQDLNRGRELKRNLEEWTGSPASLLFFNSICELSIGDVALRRQVVGAGPVPGSERVRLTGCGEHDLFVFRSSEEPFPDEAVREIRQERDTEDLHLPPCRVELVVGLPGDQRLYIVLPTGVTIGMPFSCNAPFLQDPARTAIKAPSTSPTNRWLLQRLGQLAGNTLCGWLRSSSLTLDVRANAYCLLPRKAEDGDSVGADATSALCGGFAEATGEKLLLLTTAGLLVRKGECIAPPREAYSVWTPIELLEVFGDGQTHVLSEMVEEQYRHRLQSWAWLDRLDTDVLVNRLSSGRRIPRPATLENLLILWCLVQKTIRYDYGGQQRRRLALVPVEKFVVLFPANDVVRLSSKKETISDESWNFLAGLVRIIDRQWLEYLGKTTGLDTDIEAGRQLLRDLNLERPSDVNDVVGNACQRFFSQVNIGLRECVRIAHIMAALDALTPAEFLCVTRDGKRRKPCEGVVAAFDASMGGLFPVEWAESRFLHEDYFRDPTACTKREWQAWVASPKSGFTPFAVIAGKATAYWSRNEVERLLESRQAERPWSYPYVRESFKFYDFDFEDALLNHWHQTAKDDPGIWVRVLERVVAAPDWYWKDRTHAKLKQLGTTYQRDIACGPVPSAWIGRFSALRCLPDTQGAARAPAELYLRTPETEPLMGVEPFVRAEMDVEATKPLLRLLGVRDTPAGLDKLLARIRALAGVSNSLSLLHEIIKWYGALDRVLARCDSRGLAEAREAFGHERLILTGSGEWASSAEVFQRTGEDDLPDAPVVHPSVQDLGMWARLGVADRPSAELVLDWLRSLGPGRALDPATVRRARSALQRYPVQAWENCRHWLALDNTWTPVEELRFRLTMRGLTKWGDLFPVVKSRTANLQMLSADICDRQPFSSLPDLGGSVEYRLTEPPRELWRPVEKPWLASLSHRLQRVKLADEAQTQRVRQVAARLGRSVWRPFTTIGVTPYVDGAPAGQPHSPDVLWHQETIFVREGRLAKSFDALVAELARPFASEAVTEAIKVCIERDEGFIAEYMEEHFTFEAEPAPLPLVPKSPPGVGEDQAGSRDEKEAEHTSITVEDSPKPPLGRELTDERAPEEETNDERGGDETPPRRERQVPLFDRFALAHGYRWDGTRHRFIHPDGSWIERCERPFHWQRFNVAGEVTTRYWAAQQCLTRGGVEIAAELWELLRGNPEGCYLILVDGEDRLRELAGQDLIRMVADKVITLYPAKYRIRENSEA